MNYVPLMFSPAPSRDAAVLRDSLLRSPGDPLEEETAAQLTGVLTEIQRLQAADEVLVAWHDAGATPVFLFGDGSAQARSDVEREMVACASEVAATGSTARSEWRDLQGVDAGLLLTTTMPAQGGVVTLTSLFRRMGAKTRLEARDALTRLLPLVQPLFWMWGLRRRLVARLRGLTVAVNNTGIGIMLVDRQGQAVFANAAAEAMLDDKDGLRLNGAMVGGGKLADTMRLRAAIEHVIEADQPWTGGVSPVVALSRRDRRPLLAAVVRADGPPADHGAPAAVLYLFDPEQDLCRLIEPACKLYKLSPVETRLTCLLADGVSLAEAAERMHVREQTARSYLKQIFGKTGTSRQAELVWLMLKSSVRTAPGCRTEFV